MKHKINENTQIKVLFLDINIHYIAPTRNLVPSMLGHNLHVTMYGPGYSSEKTLKNGLNQFYKKNGPFDFILASEHIIFFQDNLKGNKGKSLNDIYSKNYVLRFQNFLLDDFFNNALNFFYHTKIKKIITMFETDYIYISSERTNILKSLDCYMIAEGHQLIIPSKNLKKGSYEKFSNKATDNWTYFAKDHYDKIISLPHFVSEGEFVYGDIQNRTRTINVPGVNYYYRTQAIKKLKKAKIKMDSKYHLFFYSLMSKLGMRPFSNSNLIKLYNNIFTESIINSKYCFSCGSTVEVTLRKFFEVPACGSLLILEPFSFEGNRMLKSLGFIDGHNFISCHNENLIDKIAELERNTEYASKIALRGQEMVFKNHSAVARSEQIFKSLDAISKGQFKGTSWVKGKFKLI